MIHSETFIGSVCTALGFPKVVPQNGSRVGASTAHAFSFPPADTYKIPFTWRIPPQHLRGHPSEVSSGDYRLRHFTTDNRRNAGRRSESAAPPVSHAAWKMGHPRQWPNSLTFGLINLCERTTSLPGIVS